MANFQWVVDNASTLSINRLDTVAQTEARDGTIRATSRGTPKKRITIQLPNGPRWDQNVANIVGLEALGRTATEVIQIKYSLYPWYYNYINPGINETYTVICVEFPQWTIFEYNQVQWSGPFVFVEV
jgi:hypothetical protein